MIILISAISYDYGYKYIFNLSCYEIFIVLFSAITLILASINLIFGSTAIKKITSENQT